MKARFVGLALVGALLAARARAEDAPLTGALREAVERTFAGDLDGADRTLAAARARAPESLALPVYEIETRFWRIAYDRTNERYDEAILARVGQIERAAERRLAAHPDDAEALYYRGYARTHGARLDVMRERYLSAGLTGERARRDLERALAIDPSLVDAKLPLGLYYYYAGTLPTALRWLDWLWFVPKGDPAEGLRLLHEVERRGDLGKLGALWTLADVYSYLEEKPELGLPFFARLLRRFPDNPIYQAEHVFALFEAKRYGEAIREAHRLEARLADRPDPNGLASLARIWRARSLLQQSAADDAHAVLATFAEGEPRVPGWAQAHVLLARGQIADALGRRSDAVSLYRAVRSLDKPRRSHWAADQAGEYLESAYRVPEAPQAAIRPGVAAAGDAGHAAE